ncbi:hypothetical protein [Kingella sp. (in: b-proteobacteria)]|nr:hypothetical protein [Kingella sp. (in: b-proteobacteria)]MDO4658585.1 hypothetical protein [Kingella sp. (in: b-proteobacteria)]
MRMRFGYAELRFRLPYPAPRQPETVFNEAKTSPRPHPNPAIIRPVFHSA